MTPSADSEKEEGEYLTRTPKKGEDVHRGDGKKSLASEKNLWEGEERPSRPDHLTGKTSTRNFLTLRKEKTKSGELGRNCLEGERGAAAKRP